MSRLTKIALAGWKSIRCLDPPLKLGPINVFIGANGTGKSNLISFFKLLNEMMGERLQEYVARQGGAESLLHFGSKVSPLIEADLTFETDTGDSSYLVRLAHAVLDVLIFTEERLEFQRRGRALPKQESLGAGHRETKIIEASAAGNKTADVFRYLISHCRVFHFHDTSETAKLRQSCYAEANRHLYPDAGNLAAMLYLYQQANRTVFRRIVSAVRKIVPFFDDFVLEPKRLDPTKILLKWKGRDSDYEFGPHQLSDGSLRGMALATLLLQPERDLPDVVIIDEPELGLHPHAIEIIAGMVRSVSHRTQVILATQSAALVDHFAPEEIVVTEIDHGCTQFRRLDSKQLEYWLEDYSVGQLWEKNVIGGGPVA